MVSNRNLHFQGSIFRIFQGYVSFMEGTYPDAPSDWNIYLHFPLNVANVHLMQVKNLYMEHLVWNKMSLGWFYGSSVRFLYAAACALSLWMYNKDHLCFILSNFGAVGQLIWMLLVFFHPDIFNEAPSSTLYFYMNMIYIIQLPVPPALQSMLPGENIPDKTCRCWLQKKGHISWIGCPKSQ